MTAQNKHLFLVVLLVQDLFSATRSCFLNMILDFLASLLINATSVKDRCDTIPRELVLFFGISFAWFSFCLQGAQLVDS